ncbi:MAG: hypothetical protein IKD87_02620 [Oscillospiraceae bacterium]|nr:hypothetical protein [Oscillospiraceae bacterium]
MKRMDRTGLDRGPNGSGLEKVAAEFDRRYRIKKTVNAVFNLLIAVCGMFVFLYTIIVQKRSLLNRLKYMTFCSTLFTSAASLFTFVVCILEARRRTEVTKKAVYFLRLSAALTESIVLAVVLFGLTPLVPDNPDIRTMVGIMTHLVIPPMTVVSFIFNEAPIGRLKPLEPFLGTWYITTYAAVMTFLFGSGIVPSELAPYSFLDFKHHSFFYPVMCLAGIYLVGYLVALALSKLNMKCSWIWFHGIGRIAAAEKDS